MKNAFLCLDAGHGGEDNGAAWGEKYDYLEEDDTNLDITFYLQYELALAGFKTILTREGDITVSLGERVEIAKQAACDAYISIHCDAFHNITAKGMSVHVFPQSGANSRDLADKVLKQMSMMFPDHINRGVKESNFYVLRNTPMPAILVECEFVSNPDTRKFLKEPENKRALAQAIALGVMKHFA